MLSTLSDNTTSLSLALDARLAIKALNVYRKDGVSEDRLQKAIGDAIKSLNALSSGSSLFDNITSSSPYESYSQIQTLREVQSEFADDHLADKLAASLGHTDVATREKSVDFAINFFVALENRALRKYNQSFAGGI
jgi:hypothetical protein